MTPYRLIDVYSFGMYRNGKARAKRKRYGVPRISGYQEQSGNPVTPYGFIDVYSFGMYGTGKARAKRKRYRVPGDPGAIDENCVNLPE